MSNRRFTLGTLVLSAFVWGCQDAPAPVAPDGDQPAAVLEVAPPSSAPMAAGGPTGAIFTTTPDGGIVNENVHYQNKLFVYLDGGPPPNAPQTAAGLDDGWYVFQITDPSGGMLLSQDPSKCRVFEVTNGIITGLVSPSAFGLGDTYTVGKGANAQVFSCHVQDAPDPPNPAGPDDAGASGHHDTNVDVDHGADGAVVVQMMPYGTTPNPGGVYKAWVTPFQIYQDRNGDLDDIPAALSKGKQRPHECPDFCADNDPGFGPPRSVQKTDNFKVLEAPPALHVFKFEDLNGDGVRQETEPLIEGWKITITETLFDGTTITNECFTSCWRAVAAGATVTVSEDLPEGWVQSYLTVDGVSVTITTQPTSAVVEFAPGQMEATVVFGNFRFASKSGDKFHDLNANGVRDEGEPGLADWTIKLDGTDGMGNAVNLTTTTDENGHYAFTGVAPGSYTVGEVCDEGWSQSMPAPTNGCGSGVYDITLESGEVDAGNDFGNYQFATKSGAKFHDLNANGVRDADDAGLAGWTIKIAGTDGMGNAVSAETTTDADGNYSFSLAPGTYTVSEVCQAGWEQSLPTPTNWCGSGVYDITLESGEVDAGNDFGNYQFATKSGAKFHDLNANGVRDADDAGLAGWTIKIAGTDGMGNAVSAETTTDADGNYSFSLAPGTYTVSEVCQAGWEQSLPTPTNWCGSGVYDITLESGEVDADNDFGNFMPADIHAHKFFDFNENGVQDADELAMEGIEFCLYEGDPAAALVSCQNSDADGMVWWMDQRPGTYTVEETLPDGWFSTTGTSQSITLLSGETAQFEFGNIANCVGLTPGYWQNWQNHYTEAQFLTLLEGTIAEGDIALAEFYLTSQGCDDGDALHCMRRFLLANQLTLNLTQHSEFPNPSGGSLFLACRVDGQEGNLGTWIAQALEIHDADGEGFTREFILLVKTVLDTFANMIFIVG